jgi:hypothetical protein
MSATDQTPVLDLLGTMTEASVMASELDAQTLMLVRIAALVAVDAPPASYLMNLGAAANVEISAGCARRRPQRERDGDRSARATELTRSRRGTTPLTRLRLPLVLGRGHSRGGNPVLRVRKSASGRARGHGALSRQ